MGQTKNWAIAVIIFTTALTSCAQILWKKGVIQEPFSNLFLLFILAGMGLYGIGAVLMIIAFKGGEVTVLYPIFASSYVWVVLLSNYFFDETITALKVIGVAIVITGIVFISYGSKKGSAIQYEEAV